MSEEENEIICLNYCTQDPESGYCLTCGRPPIPVAAFNPKMFGKLSLENMTIVERPREITDENPNPD